MIEQIQAILDPFTRVGINKLDGQILGMFIKAADEVLKILQEQEVPKTEAYKLLTYSATFANIVAVTPYKTTDQWLDLFTDPVKLMFLYTGRNKKQLESRSFFQFDVDLASLWFAQFVLPVIGCTDIDMQCNLERHYRQMNRKCRFVPQSTHAYFWVDYVIPELARSVKQRFNRSIGVPIVTNYPKSKNIAIVTGNWKPTHAVVKSIGKVVYALADKYSLTLVHLGQIDSTADLSIFKNVLQVTCSDIGLDLSEIQNTNFGLALFLDIGLTPESIYLSNMRLAPAQVACLGHPVSGRNNQIDYFLSGKLIETIGAKRHYSENLRLLPGSGVLPYFPSYQRKNLLLSDSVRVAVPWSAIKYNMPMFRCLKELQDAGAHLVFIPGSSINRYQASIPVRMSMLEYFGRNITIVPNLPYTEYMKVLESCHFAVDSYPFGGYTTIVDALWCGLPIVTLEGNQWFNRVASYLLRRVGLEELVTDSYKQYTMVAKSLLDPTKLDKIRKQVSQVDFEYLIGSDKTEDFVEAIGKLTGVKNE
jgi:hypothetical protein